VEAPLEKEVRMSKGLTSVWNKEVSADADSDHVTVLIQAGLA